MGPWPAYVAHLQLAMWSWCASKSLWASLYLNQRQSFVWSCRQQQIPLVYFSLSKTLWLLSNANWGVDPPRMYFRKTRLNFSAAFSSTWAVALILTTTGTPTSIKTWARRLEWHALITTSYTYDPLTSSPNETSSSLHYNVGISWFSQER